MTKLLLSVALALAAPLGAASRFTVSKYELLKGGRLCGSSPKVGEQFNSLTTFGACGLHYGGQYQVDLKQPIKGFDGFQWTFSVNECCGGRSIYFFDDNSQKWIGYSGGGGSHRQTLTKSGLAHKNARITKIKFIYGGRSTAARSFYTYGLKFLKNGEQVLPAAITDKQLERQEQQQEKRDRKERLQAIRAQNHANREDRKADRKADRQDAKQKRREEVKQRAQNARRAAVAKRKESLREDREQQRQAEKQHRQEQDRQARAAQRQAERQHKRDEAKAEKQAMMQERRADRQAEKRQDREARKAERRERRQAFRKERKEKIQAERQAERQQRKADERQLRKAAGKR